jgi:hypothetical protein
MIFKILWKTDQLNLWKTKKLKKNMNKIMELIMVKRLTFKIMMIWLFLQVIKIKIMKKKKEGEIFNKSIKKRF